MYIFVWYDISQFQDYYMEYYVLKDNTHFL